MTDRRPAAPGLSWREFCDYQAAVQAWLQESADLAVAALSRTPGEPGTAAPLRPSGKLLCAPAKIDVMKRSPLWRLRGIALRILKATGVRQRG